MIKKIIKKFLIMIKKTFIKVKYINNYIYMENLLENRTALITGGAGIITFDDINY